MVVETNDLSDAVKKLKPRKHDGQSGLWSNFIIWMPAPAREKLSLLLNAMLSHGHTPSIINIGTIISIPKDLRGDICSSDNYRGIALSSAISKLMEIILITKSGNSIVSSNLQFAYKANHGTSMCTLLLKETANHFMNRKSGVYCALIDASKAFDRLRHDKLFNILIERRVPPIIVRFLIDNYQKQKMQVRWGSIVSRSFGVQNGVKQGGILSPILFNVYMDILLERLKNNGIGCHVGGTFVGALSYADDLTLLSPSLQGLRSMLRVCEHFGQEFSVSFNPVKTQCIHFRRVHDSGPFKVYLDGKPLKWVDEVKHLGHIISYNLSEAKETKAKAGEFIYSVNSLRANFKNVNIDVLIRLFKSYCTVFYGSQTWDLSQAHVQNVYTKFNRGVRLLLHLPFTTHRNILPVLLQCQPLNIQIAKRFFKMYTKMSISPNIVVQNFVTVMSNDQMSIISKNINLYNHLCESNPTPDVELVAKCRLIKELIEIMYSDVKSLESFEFNELEFILCDICTN